MPDPEIAAMGAVADAVAPLEDDARGRVIRWAAERYGVSLAGAKPRSPVDRLTGNGTDEDEYGDDEEHAVDRSSPRHFEHFAELYDAVGPSSDPERVLVASYWHQIINGKASFGSQLLNKDLKDLGHAVGTINKAMAANMQKRPALILQVARGGNSRQARKTYKLSDAGRKWVEEKLA